ncbi:hypothetical protein GQ53DRAFT_759955 [Thozetella sp. PMI_491]|nr:hypothetical protein GQ53DRAFT_759955 [Thozetella sp. PMI_491]
MVAQGNGVAPDHISLQHKLEQYQAFHQVLRSLEDDAQDEINAIMAKLKSELQKQPCDEDSVRALKQELHSQRVFLRGFGPRLDDLQRDITIVERDLRRARPSTSESDDIFKQEPGMDIVEIQSRSQAQRPGSSPGIEFDVLFQNGKAEEKHQIIEFPRASERWYILKCESPDHTRHFGEKELLSCARFHARHKHSIELLGLTDSIIVQRFGQRVLNCTENKADRNNYSFLAALLKGYVPKGEPENITKERLWGYGKGEIEERMRVIEERLRLQRDSPPPRRRRHPPKPFIPAEEPPRKRARKEKRPPAPCSPAPPQPSRKANNPRVNQVYCARIRDTWHAILVLTVPGRETAGTQARLRQDACLRARMPADGFRINAEVGSIDREGVEAERRFPVLWFDLSATPVSEDLRAPGWETEKYDWLSADDIWELDTSLTTVVGLSAVQQRLREGLTHLSPGSGDNAQVASLATRPTLG